MLNTDFGYAVQWVIENDFTSRDPIHNGGNLTIGTLVGLPALGGLRLRPDLFHQNGVNSYFFEIKSATASQIAIGTAKIALYNTLLNYYSYGWRPGVVSDYFYWGQNGPLITSDDNGAPLSGGDLALVLPPVGGLITYVKIPKKHT